MSRYFWPCAGKNDSLGNFSFSRDRVVTWWIAHNAHIKVAGVFKCSTQFTVESKTMNGRKLRYTTISFDGFSNLQICKQISFAKHRFQSKSSCSKLWSGNGNEWSTETPNPQVSFVSMWHRVPAAKYAASIVCSILSFSRNSFCRISSSKLKLNFWCKCCTSATLLNSPRTLTWKKDENARKKTSRKKHPSRKERRKTFKVHAFSSTFCTIELAVSLVLLF